MELPLVDVNSDTVSQTWPLLLLAVKQAHFISLDLVRVTQPEYPLHVTFNFFLGVQWTWKYFRTRQRRNVRL